MTFAMTFASIVEAPSQILFTFLLAEFRINLSEADLQISRFPETESFSSLSLSLFVCLTFTQEWRLPFNLNTLSNSLSTGPSSEQRSGSSNSRGNPFGRGPNSPGGSKPDSSKPNKPRDPDEEIEDDIDVFKCPKPDGLYADPFSCKKFYLCGAYKAYHQSCPPSLYFDDKLKFCTFKTADLRCGPVEGGDNDDDSEKFNQENLHPCDKKSCQLPNCFCSDDGTFIPGTVRPKSRTVNCHISHHAISIWF